MVPMGAMLETPWLMQSTKATHGFAGITLFRGVKNKELSSTDDPPLLSETCDGHWLHVLKMASVKCQTLASS